MIEASHYRKILRQRLETLLCELDHHRQDTDTVELDQTRVGRLSRMDAMQIQQMELALSRRQQDELVAIKQALMRLDSGEYGQCFECSEEIDPRRLEIDPIATLCISCAQQRES